PFGGQLFFTTSNNGANASAENGYVEVKCRDTGEGIEDEIKPRIFDPLFTTKLRGRGSGLGLAVVSQKGRGNGGGVEGESDAGQGAEFRIRFPVVEPIAA